jgi:hypothetical protein
MTTERKQGAGSLRAKARRTALAGLLLLGAGETWLAAPAWAQVVDPPAVQDYAVPAAPQKTMLTKSLIHLPIQVSADARAQLQEIQLYVKERPGEPWKLREKAVPTQNGFTFQAPRDGEYAFAMVTVDRQGKQNPPDIQSEPAGLIVAIDTQPPVIELRSMGTTNDGMLVQCEVRDANADPVKTVFQYQTADLVFRPLDPVADRPNVYCVPAQARITGMIRVAAADTFGNTAQTESNISQLAPAGRATPVAQGPMEPAPVVPAVALPTVGGVNPPVIGAGNPMKIAGTDLPMPQPFRVDHPSTIVQVQKPDLTTPAQSVIPVVQVPSFQPLPVKTPESSPIQPLPSKVQDALPGQAREYVQNAIPDPRLNPQVIPQRREGAPQQRQLVNHPHVYLEYQIDQAGASGVGKVEVWITRDQGKSWQKLCEDADRKSPAEINLPGEGLFGVSLVVGNGRGFGATPPNPGDTPDWWIEVDTTKPAAEITGIRSGAENGASVQIAWTARDKNLGADPVDLFYATNRQGPWLPIARGLKNDGQYRWNPPTEVGQQVHVRLVVRDQAGNISVAETPQPVVLDDQSRPRGQILGVSTGTPTRVAPQTPTPAPLPSNGNFNY